MEFLTCEMPAFFVIGKEGEARPGCNPAPALWAEANAHYAEVDALALRDEKGIPAGFWGAMSDLSRSFLPWEDNLSRGLYLAGVQVGEDAMPPEGWVKWTVPAFRYVYASVEGDYAEALNRGLACLQSRGLTLAGAVQDYHCPEENGQLYLFFPIQRL